MSHSLDYHTNAEREFDDPCDTSGHPQTDVRWDNNDLDPGVRGQTSCAERAPETGYCDRFQVVLDLAQLNHGDNDEQDQDKTACHELGHSVGLGHHDDGGDCMRNGERPDNDDKWEHYSPHHEDHINAWF